MANFCGKCGTPAHPDSDFCPVCGNKYENGFGEQYISETESASVLQPQTQTKSGMSKSKKLGLIFGIIGGIIVTIVIIVILIVNWFDSNPNINPYEDLMNIDEYDINYDRSSNKNCLYENNLSPDYDVYENIADDFYESMFVNSNVQNIVEMMPEKYFDYVMDRANMDKARYTQVLQDTLNEQLSYIDDKFGYDSYVTWGISNVRIIEGEEKEKNIEIYESYYGFDNISEIRVIETTATLNYTSDSGEKTVDDPIDIVILNIGRIWYYDPTEIDDIVRNITK